jgi:DNA-binding winged helix-turn-helix (wHTH) protein
LWYGSRPIKIERIPLELLFLLLENGGKLVSRTQIVAKLWGGNVFLDSERSINTAVRKIRRALGDDSRHPQFVETVVGQGYRFIAPLVPECQVQNNYLDIRSGTLRQEIDRTEDNEIRLRSFSVETISATAVLTCEVVVDNLPLGRLPLLELGLPSGVTLPIESKDRLLLKLRGVGIALTAQAAQALHAFSISVLQNGSRPAATETFSPSEEARQKQILQFTTQVFDPSNNVNPAREPTAS